MEGHFIMIKEIMHQEDITLSNIYAPNQGALKYIKQLLTELKGESDQNICCLQEIHLFSKQSIDSKGKGGKRYFEQMAFREKQE